MEKQVDQTLLLWPGKHPQEKSPQLMVFHLIFGLLLFYIRDPHLYLFWSRVGSQRIKNCAVQAGPQVCKSGGKRSEGQFLIVSGCLPEACKGLSHIVFSALQP